MPPADKYRTAGVDLEEGALVKERIAEAVRSTSTELARGVPGGFGGMLGLPAGVNDPILVLSTDGVGTKVLVALRAGVHDTVGEDLVNHCVNDILVHGARPIGFQDYIATADMNADVVTAVVEGVARGCRNHEMVLAGGETAQMPDLYAPGHYDLAGTIVGVVAAREALHGDKVQNGDLLVGYAANGLHTNGYTLARRVLFDRMGLDVDSIFPGEERTVGSVLLEVHPSYRNAVVPALAGVHGLAHITGGGLPGNVSRILPPGHQAVVDAATWEVPNVFSVIARQGGVSREEMFRVFNMGVGMVAVAPAGEVDRCIDLASRAGCRAWVMGEIRSGEGVLIQ